MKRKPPSKRVDKNRQLAEAITDRLFSNGDGVLAATLKMFDAHGWFLGGWSRESVIKLILRKLRDAK